MSGQKDNQQGSKQEQQQEPGAPAGAKNSDTPGDDSERMIPLSRFNEINNQLKELKQQVAAQEEAAKKASDDKLAEQQEWQKLAEQRGEELAAAQAKAAELELAQLRTRAATKAGLPLTFATRLQGETLEELVADAEAMLAAMPKPSAPNINANGRGVTDNTNVADSVISRHYGYQQEK